MDDDMNFQEFVDPHKRQSLLEPIASIKEKSDEEDNQSSVRKSEKDKEKTDDIFP